MADKHPVRDKIIGGLILAAILSFVTFILPGGWGSVFHGFHQFFHWLWLWLISDSAISTWLLCILIILSLGFVITVLFLVFAKLSEGNNLVQALNFTEGDFFGIHWRWRNVFGDIQGLASFCPHCDLQIYPRATRFGVLSGESPVIYRCDDCQRDLYESDFSHSQVEDLVARKIQQRIREYARKPDAT